MKRRLLILVAVCSMLCLVACGAESKGDVNASIDDEPTAKPVVEATAEPTEELTPTQEPVAEATAEPEVIATAEPNENSSVVYEGIDMESDLPGEEWVETFVGIIEEPKIVVFSDENGRKEIFEKNSKVKVNPESDMIGIYIPDGYRIVDEIVGILEIEIIYSRSCFEFYKLEAEKTREWGPQMAAFYVEYEGEKIEIPFVFIPE